MFSAAVMVPVHDHFQAQEGMFGPMLDGEIMDDYTHDPRCSGECRHGGACQLVGIYCDGRCDGCNAYNCMRIDGYFSKDDHGYTVIVPADHVTRRRA